MTLNGRERGRGGEGRVSIIEEMKRKNRRQEKRRMKKNVRGMGLKVKSKSWKRIKTLQVEEKKGKNNTAKTVKNLKIRGGQHRMGGQGQ